MAIPVLKEKLKSCAISPVKEISAYEALWSRYPGVKQIADIFKRYNHAPPSAITDSMGISNEEVEKVQTNLLNLLPFTQYSALFHKSFEYPVRLREAEHPVEVLYYQGALDLLSSRSVAVVGAREASENGKRRARRVAKLLVENGFTVMSGLAKGIDTAAHESTIEAGGKTIAVIGTPLNTNYPKQNKKLQEKISKEYLLVSQVPFYFYSSQDYRKNRFFFPERNKTMSALSEATIIIEASETSGTLTQARAALQQGRKLFILKSCFEKGLKWPDKFLKQGAVKVIDGSEILKHLDS